MKLNIFLFFTSIIFSFTTAFPPIFPNHHDADPRAGLVNDQLQTQSPGKAGNAHRCEFSLGKTVVGLVLGGLVLIGEELWRWEVVGEGVGGLVLEGL